MRALYIRLEALSPLAIRSDHTSGAGVASDYNYVPGTTFAGALASVHRLLRPDRTDEFERWFLSGQIHYPNLYPAIFDDEGLNNRHNLPVYPVPRTAQTCKRYPGFLFPDKEENDAHGVRDSLIDWALFTMSLNNTSQVNPVAALEEHKECQCCKARMDSFTGYYRRNDREGKENQLIAAKEHKRLSTHSGIDRKTGTVQENILYNLQVFEEGMRFWGSLAFPDDEQLVSDFMQFLDELGRNRRGEGTLRVGTARTRGMGKVAISAAAARTAPDAFEFFQKRLNDFSKLLRDEANKSGLNIPDNTFFFALTLHSPLLLRDELLRYRGTLDAAALQELLAPTIPELTCIYQNARVRRVTGWQDLWGLPRTKEYAIETGSVFLFSCPFPPDTAVYQALFELEEQGAGQRRGEGFGRLRVSDQFHQEIKML